MRLDPAGRCPICSTPWYAKDRGTCDHEAGWYRGWLEKAYDAMDGASRLRFAAELQKDIDWISAVREDHA